MAQVNSLMSRYVFVPLTDEILYEHPELINGPIVPYRAGNACYHWLSVELNPEDQPRPKTKPRMNRGNSVFPAIPARLIAHSH